jgi:hypothetical protein
MIKLPSFDIEERLRLAGANMVYPPTPDIATQVRSQMSGQLNPPRTYLRRLAWGAAVAVILLLGLLAVPGVRAQVLEFLQIGIVKIFLVEPSPTPLPTAIPPSSSLAVPAVASVSPTPQPTEQPTPTPLSTLLDLAGETSLEQATHTVGFPIQLPAYPPDLGIPDRVFSQDLDGNVLVLVWLDPLEPGKIRLSLHQFSGRDNITITKAQPVTVQETTVSGNPAVWAEGPYLLKLRDGDIDIVRMIAGHVLIWEQAGITFRLETDLSLEEAVRIAESLQPWP